MSLLGENEAPDVSGGRDADRDAPSGDTVGQDRPSGTGGGNAAGSGGAGGRDAGTDGRDAGAGGQDAGSGGAGGQDADSGGTVGGSGGSGGRAGSDGGGGVSSDADASGGGTGDGAPGCTLDSACADRKADIPDAIPDGIVDQCPGDPLKTAPGVCGCGTSDADTDTDGTADCVDGCPSDIGKTQPGICGCNAVDPSDSDAGQAFCIKAFLAHRYSFNGTGTVATDSIAAANGTIMGGANATMSGGSLDLSGDRGARYMNEGYVSLPSNLVTPLSNATFEVWAMWRGAGSSGSQVWQRLFDFGNQVASGSEQVGSTYLFLTAHATSSGFLRAAFSINGSANETFINATHPFPLNAQAHVAVVADDANNTMTLYLNGDPEGTVAWTGTLASISNVNSWLGRSNYGVDPEFNGVLYEFRIYRAPLSAAQVHASYLAGPDPPFF